MDFVFCSSGNEPGIIHPSTVRPHVHPLFASSHCLFLCSWFLHFILSLTHFAHLTSLLTHQVFFFLLLPSVLSISILFLVMFNPAFSAYVHFFLISAQFLCVCVRFSLPLLNPFYFQFSGVSLSLSLSLSSCVNLSICSSPSFSLAPFFFSYLSFKHTPFTSRAICLGCIKVK